jgi:OPA family glycerol-3-phosphate transporter-like MFS transporter
VDNEIVFSVILFGIGSLCALALAALFDTNAAVSVVLVAFLTGSMHGVNLMLICNLPARFADTGKVSLISGVLNACTYVGSAISTYGFALIAQAFGWRTTVVCWAFIAATGLVMCVLGGRKCKRIFEKG